MEIPLFPLKTVLYPGGRLPLRVFEQRYIGMTKACLRDGLPFGVCLIREGEEVAGPGLAPPEFAEIGTTCRIVEWDMRQLGILEVIGRGEQRMRVLAHRTELDGLAIGEVEALPVEPSRPAAPRYAPAAAFVEKIVGRVGSEHFLLPHALDDASWVGFRLAELLPIPLTAKQGLLEIDDPETRLALLTDVLRRHDLL
jgi:Lon protease-like protein